jgi:hypothetical protein
MGLVSMLKRLAIALLIAVGLFYFCPTQYLYYVLIIGVGIYSVLGNETHFLLAFFGFLLVAVLIIFASLAQTAGFFVEVWNLMTPEGPNMSWSIHLPQYFFYVLPISIAIMMVALGFVGGFYQGWADQYLAFAFSKYMILIFFISTLLNCFFVGITLYAFLSTTPWTLFIWELIFTWLPFFTLSFIAYSLLGRVFDREERSEREYRDRVDRLDRRQEEEDKREKQKQKQEKERKKHNEHLKQQREQDRKKGGHR